jgi:hypothetical protein
MFLPHYQYRPLSVFLITPSSYHHAEIIFRMPARSSGETSGHALIREANSGWLLMIGAKKDAKSFEAEGLSSFPVRHLAFSACGLRNRRLEVRILSGVIRKASTRRHLPQTVIPGASVWTLNLITYHTSFARINAVIGAAFLGWADATAPEKVALVRAGLTEISAMRPGIG